MMMTRVDNESWYFISPTTWLIGCVTGLSMGLTLWEANIRQTFWSLILFILLLALSFYLLQSDGKTVRELRQ